MRTAFTFVFSFGQVSIDTAESDRKQDIRHYICKIFLQHVKVVASVFENFITIRSKTNGVYRLQYGVPFGVLSSVRPGVRSGVRSGVQCPVSDLVSGVRSESDL